MHLEVLPSQLKGNASAQVGNLSFPDVQEAVHHIRCRIGTINGKEHQLPLLPPVSGLLLHHIANWG